MPAETNRRRNLLWALGIFCLILVSFRVYAAKEMDSLPAPFTIEIDGTPIAKAPADAADRTQAHIGTEPAAVFELKDKRLQSDGHILARALSEDRSFSPKKVMWFKADTTVPVYDVVAAQDGEDYSLQFSGAGLMASDGQVFADIMGTNPSRVVVKMQS
ncbi:hypothetical protein ACJQWK_00731 [Exserohilum turcicum]|uniref:LPS export ABC transporter periplasmic protein LptC n=1 Tax=Exserohilum turcicum (strain 28A) TaxID=671987 RepID=R0IFG1_EXST2|nr:uncharacterized protein SETTUDRAFT_172567 [Exserohilum turcica Et28A]EOA84010.1 hypothetical protein SETTUDRAFT_172567 [Exserohilum turcica Et28A]